MQYFLASFVFIATFTQLKILTQMKRKYAFLASVFALLFVQVIFAQSNTVSGKVLADDGIPLPGASVIIKGTTNGTTTDFDGNFSLSIENSNGKILEVSYIGYQSKELALTGQDQNLTITLNAASNNLDEVILVGSSITSSRKKIRKCYYYSKICGFIKNSPS